MSTGEPTDVTSTLTDLERKLVDLERELSSVTGPVSSIAAPAVAPPTPADTHRSALRVEDLRGEIADLVKFRDQLEAAAHELVSEYDRLVERLRGSSAAAQPPAPAPMPTPAPPAPVVPEAASVADPGPVSPFDPSAALPPAVAAGIPGQPRPEAPPAAAADDSRTYEGAVVIDAGPFNDITTLQAFEQGLSRVEGAEDVYVRSFEGNRALIDVRLSNPVPLVQLLRDQLPLPITTREAGEGRLIVDVAESHGT